MTAVLPFGSWPTPVTSELVVASASRVIDVRADGDDLVWVESRPGEGGRSVLVRRRADGTITELVGGDANVRTAVHEYGGGAWWVHEGAVWYRSEEHTSELQSLMRISYAVFCLTKKNTNTHRTYNT